MKALVLLASLVGLTSCAHMKPVVEEFTDCAAPSVIEAGKEAKGRVVDVLLCSELSPELLPPCALVGLADLYKDHGHDVVNCIIVAIRDSFSAPANATPDQLERARLVRARAAAAIKREEQRGAHFVSRPAP